MACVIAQRRVQPIVVNGNPLTEHYQLLCGRMYACTDQQVLSLSGWKSRLQPRRSDLSGGNSNVTDSYFQDALT